MFLRYFDLVNILSDKSNSFTGRSNSFIGSNRITDSIDATDPTDLQGHVIKLSEEGGEIRRVDTGEEIPFNKEDMERDGGLHKLTLKCEVSFILKEVLGSVGTEVRYTSYASNGCHYLFTRLSVFLYGGCDKSSPKSVLEMIYFRYVSDYLDQ